MSAPHQPVRAEKGAAILRLHHVEGWLVGTIASQIHRHHDTVERVLGHGGLPITKQVQRGRLVEGVGSDSGYGFGESPSEGWLGGRGDGGELKLLNILVKRPAQDGRGHRLAVGHADAGS